MVSESLSFSRTQTPTNSEPKQEHVVSDLSQTLTLDQTQQEILVDDQQLPSHSNGNPVPPEPDLQPRVVLERLPQTVVPANAARNHTQPTPSAQSANSGVSRYGRVSKPVHRFSNFISCVKQGLGMEE